MKYERYPGELYHFGIKGMKWGVRRNRKKLGYKDSSNKTKVTHRQKLEDKYKKEGFTAQQAKALAERRIRTEKVIAVAAGITITAAAAYGVNKYVKYNVDQTIKSGVGLQRIEYNKDGYNLHDIFYATNKKSDNKKYAAFLANQRRAENGGPVYKMTIKTTKDLKVASRKSAINIFEDLYKNDSSFRKTVDDKIIRSDSVKKGKISKIYDVFNQQLVYAKGDKDYKKAYDKFYNVLNDKGYAAIQDMNDMKLNRVHAKNPLIFINSNSNLKVSNFNEMTNREITNNFNKYFAKEVTKNILKQPVSIGAAGVGAYITAKNYTDKPINDKKIKW